MRASQPGRYRGEMTPARSNRDFRSFVDDFFRDMERDSSWDRALAERSREGFSEFSPSVDVEENEEMYLISVDLPGIKREDIKIDISGNTLKVSGNRSREVKEEGYYERSSGRFSRSFTLPSTVDAKRAEANFEDGVLRIALPKTEVKSAQEIKVQSGQPQGLLDRFFRSEKTVKSGEEKSRH